MATKFYFHDATSSVGPTSEQTSWTPNVNATGYDTPRTMTETKGAAQVSVAAASTATAQYLFFRSFVSPALAAQTIASQTVTCIIGANCGTAAKFYFGWGVYLYRGGSNVATIVADVNDGDTLDTAEEGRTATATSTVQEAQSGDRLVLEIWMNRTGTVNAYTATLYYDGTTDPVNQTGTADAASYLSFANTLLLGTTYYFHDATDVSGGPTNEQTSWTATVNATGYATPRQMTTTIGVSQAWSSTNEGNTEYGYHRVFVSPALAAQTIAAQTLLIGVGANSNLLADLSKWGYGVYVWRGGSNVGTIAANVLDATAVNHTGEIGYVETVTSTSQTLQANDQICVELWTYGSLTYTTNIYYDGTTIPRDTVAIASAASFISFGTTTIVAYTAPTYGPINFMAGF
jgi:hypothetical protein